MKKRKLPYRLLLPALLLLSLPVATTQEGISDRPDWGAIFSRYMAEGTIVIEDERTKSRGTLVFNGERASKRFSPASTFKIPHALFALDAGIVRDEFQVFPWDGIERSYMAWNEDQTLRSSMRHSVVWVYEMFAEALGEERERDYMQEIHYGNADPTGEKPFWVEGNLQISALEQITFLRQLYRNQLPFDGNAQRLVKDVMINEAGRDWILRAKTGWSGTIGWWVGWVERPTGAVFFALNMDTPNRAEDLPKREAIVREVLKSIDAIPAK
jgi:beta-lactamase class D